MAYIAPAGTPVTFHDIARGIACQIRGVASDAELLAGLRNVSGQPHAWPVSSGRAAMTLTLRAISATAKDSSRNEVIVPAYTCYSVPASIERAGLRLRLCDVNPDTLGIDLDKLWRFDFSRVLTVVSSNLYGLPNDLPTIETICRKRGVYFLDDAAQALGATMANRPVGSFGDAGIYSFDKGKIISTVQGGAIVAGTGKIADQLDFAFSSVHTPGVADFVANLVQLIVYSVFLRPSLYPIVRALPFTGLGHTRYDPSYPISRLSIFASAVASRLLSRLNELGSARRRNADRLRCAIDERSSVTPWEPLPGAIPAYARFPIRVQDPSIRASIIAAFNRAGIGATSSYPMSLADVPEIRSKLSTEDLACPGARKVAATIVTLPTHAYCPADLPDRVCKVIDACTA